MNLRVDEDGDHENEGDDGCHECGADELPARYENEVERDHPEESEKCEFQGDPDEIGAVEGETQDIEHRKEPDTDRENLHSGCRRFVSDTVEDMEHLRRVGDEERDHRKEEQCHE